MRALALLVAGVAALTVAAPATSKGQMPAGWILTRAVDRELALGPYCFTDSDVNPVWLRGRCEDGAPPQADLPVVTVPCGQLAVFEVLDLQSVSVLTLQVGSKSYRLKPRAHSSVAQRTWFTARWRVHGHSGALTLRVSGDQGRVSFLALLRIRHPGCR